MPSSSGFPSVFHFTSYREFIKEYVKYRNQAGSYSLSQFSQDFGFGSKNYASLIVNGKRNLSIDDTFSMARFFKFTESETRYFDLLVRHNDCENEKQKKFYETWLEEHHELKQKNQLTVRSSDFPNLITNESIPAVLSCLSPNEARTETQVAQVTKLSLTDVKTAFQILEENEFIIKSDSGHVAQNAVIHARFGKHFRYKDFQRQQLRRSQRALSESAQNENKFLANFFLLRTEEKERLWSKIRDLISQVNSDQLISEESKLMQLNIQFFPYERGEYREL